MENLKDINDFLTEKKVTVKRRYTESHPAKNVSTSARVRTSILEAIADGHITEEEMSRILTELKAHKRWLNRNKTLFNVSEDQDGIKTFSLSPYGQRVMNATKTTIINEALSVPHKEQGKKPVNIFVGRFQPFTLGHVKVFEKMHKENGYPVVVYLVRGKKPDPEKRPFDEDLQQAMFAKMKKQYPFLEASYVVPNGAIDTLYSTARPAYEPMLWGYGTDRKKAYNGMIDKQDYRDQLGVHPDFKGFEIKRGDENISASKVRNALKIDDEKTFKQMTPKSIHSFYKTLQNTLSPIKENIDMKNLKSINEFGINEAVVTEAKGDKLKVGDHGVDYNDNTVEVIEIGNFAKIARAFKKGMKRDPSDYGYNSEPGDFYLTKNIKATEGNVGDLAIYPVKYDMENVWGLTAESVINEEYVESMDSVEIANALGKIETLWKAWRAGPMTEPSDIKPAQKELKRWLDNWFKQNIK